MSSFFSLSHLSGTSPKEPRRTALSKSVLICPQLRPSHLSHSSSLFASFGAFPTSGSGWGFGSAFSHPACCCFSASATAAPISAAVGARCPSALGSSSSDSFCFPQIVSLTPLTILEKTSFSILNLSTNSCASSIAKAAVAAADTIRSIVHLLLSSTTSAPPLLSATPSFRTSSSTTPRCSGSFDPVFPASIAFSILATASSALIGSTPFLSAAFLSLSARAFPPLRSSFDFGVSTPFSAIPKFYHAPHELRVTPSNRVRQEISTIIRLRYTISSIFGP